MTGATKWVVLVSDGTKVVGVYGPYTEEMAATLAARHNNFMQTLGFADVRRLYPHMHPDVA